MILITITNNPTNGDLWLLTSGVSVDEDFGQNVHLYLCLIPFVKLSSPFCIHFLCKTVMLPFCHRTVPTTRITGTCMLLTLTTIIRQFISRGADQTKDMNMPLLSKYCCRENNLERQNKTVINLHTLLLLNLM